MQAWWFYEDFSREQDKMLRSLTLREFCELIFHQHPSLQPHLNNLDGIYKTFTAYKHTIPVYGAILLNKGLDKCLMVKGWSANSWGFPKGKVNKDEPEKECAAREILEEVRFRNILLFRTPCLPLNF